MQPRPPPKFSSFNPPILSGAATHASHQSQASSNERPRRDPERKKHKAKPYHTSKRRDELRAMDRILTRPTTAQLEDHSRRPSQFTLEDSEISFYDDPYGESGNLFLEVKYWPPSQVRHVLGVSPPLTVSRDVKQHVFEVHIPYHFRTRSNVAWQFKAAARAKPRRLVVPPSGVLKGEVDGFIPVGKPRNTTLNNADPPEYRSITLPKDADFGGSDSDSEGIEGIESDDEDTTDAYSAETARLGHILQEDMSSVPVWLDVIAHSASTNPTAQGRADIWLTMLERAISAHPKNRQSDVLRLRYLEAMRDTQSPEEETAWERALLEIQSENLWVEYISHQLEKHGPESIEKAVTRIWRELSSVDFGVDRKHRAQLRVFWRAITGLKEAGYLERATAAVQAQVELSYFVPHSLENSSFSEILDSLEEFWDSEAPRIGENGAQGWSSWTSHSPDVVQSSSMENAMVPAPSSSNLQFSDDADGYQKWAAAEVRMDASGWLPQRDETDDPYSTVLFSDIRPLLFKPLHDSSELSMLLIFLHILGLEIPGLSESLASDGNEGDDSAWSYNPFMTKPDLLGSLFAIERSESISLTGTHQPKSIGPADEIIAGKERLMGHGWGPVKNWALGTRSLLEGYGPQGEGRMWEQADLECVNIEFIRRVFQYVNVRIKCEEWAEYWIAFEAAANIKEAIKISKAVLASYPDSLRLWSAHAFLQRMRHKPDAASKVYETCLISKPTSSFMSSDQRASERARMWLSWAEMQWIRGAHTSSARILCAAVDVTVPSDATDTRIALLRSRRAYDGALKTGDVAIGVKACLVQCLALLELIHSHDVTRALAVYADYKSIIGASASDSREFRIVDERLAVASALLTYHHIHTLKNVCRPIVLRQHVGSLVPDFPGNSLLLGVWLESERGEAIWGRVRTGIAETVLREGGSIARSTTSRISMARWAWAVWVETWERSAWHAERARNVLRRALENTRLRRSPSIWMMLLSLEARLENKATGHNLVYQATAACPWVKEFYMYAFAISHPQFSTEELRNAVNTMAERGIRLRAAHSLESYMVDRDEGTDKKSDGDWGEVELEHGASELARLRPY